MAMTKREASEHSLEYIRNYYHVPAYSGVHVKFTDTGGAVYTGKIIGGSGAYLVLDFACKGMRGNYHPTWNIEYLKDSYL